MCTPRKFIKLADIRLFKFFFALPAQIKFGYFLGYSNQEVQRTCSGCELETNLANGIFNLKVRDVKLGQDDNFECQVSPGKGAINNVPLRSPVKINIQGLIYNIYFNDLKFVSVKLCLLSPLTCKWLLSWHHANVYLYQNGIACLNQTKTDKVSLSTPVFFNHFEVAEPTMDSKNFAEPKWLSKKLCGTPVF